MYLNRGMSLRQIGVECDVELRTVGKWLRHDGIAARPRGAPVGCNAGPRKVPLSKEELVDLYVTKGMSQRAIGELYGVNDTLIGKRLQSFGIESRPTNWEHSAPRFASLSADDLRRLYVTERRTQKEIAGMYDMCSVTVSKWLRRYGIPIEAPWERRAVKIDPGEIRRLYSDEGMTVRQMAKHFSCSVWSVERNMKEHSIPTRDSDHRRAARLARSSSPRILASHGGYALVIDSRGNVVDEHRLVAETALGRPLTGAEVVHHLNLLKSDNRIENLVVLPSTSAHRQVHNYMGVVGVYLTGLSPIHPAPLSFSAPVFWGGRYVTSIDLIPQGVGPGQLATMETAIPVGVKETVN